MHPKCLPVVPSAGTVLSQHWSFLQGSDCKDLLKCLYPPTSNLQGTDPLAQDLECPYPKMGGNLVLL